MIHNKNGSRSSFTLPKPTRDIVLQTNRIKNPFDPDLQDAFKKFVNHVGNLNEHEVDLPEVSLLLRGASKIYSAQVDSVVKDVEELLRVCTRTKTASFEKKKAKKVVSEMEEDAPDGESSTEKAKELDDLDRSYIGEIGVEETARQPLDDDVDMSDSGIGSADNSPESEITENSGDLLAPEVGDNGDGVINIVDIDTITLDGDDENQAVLPAESGEAGGEDTVLANAETEELNPPSKEGEEIRPKAKKPRNGLLPPPLTSCFDEWDNLVDSGLLDPNRLDPPLLDKAIRLAKRKMYAEDNIPTAKKARGENDYSEDSGVVMSEDLPVNGAVDADIEEKDEKPDLSTLPPMPGFLLSQEFPSAAAASFSPEDQAIIQDCIHELHYLPFTFGLSKTDLSSAFSRTVARMSDVFKKNNVPVTRHMVKEASVIAKKTSPEKEKTNGLIHPVAHSLGDIYNTFVNTCRKECETFIHNTSMSIMERSKEKTFAESRANIRSMISELQRNIVPKFARVPLMAENTPEFFQHVTNFEKKMKKILEEEAKKDEFDVRKYERDVLEVTAKESSELVVNSTGVAGERFDDFLVPTSPLMRQQSIDEVGFDPVLFASQSTRSSFDGSQISSLVGSSWVPLKHIFNHMKSFDRTETARSIYAVLALLSYQNLDINYDQLYSHESAVLSGVSKEDEIDSKFPRGVKICTSRCPDADKEEVFLAALTSESRDETFRHLLNEEARNIEDAASSSSSSSSSRGKKKGTSAAALAAAASLKYNEGRIDAGIREAMADFVEEDSTVFTGRLFARQRKRKATVVASESTTMPSCSATTTPNTTTTTSTNPANNS
ncbi:uncharacterized protein LOC110858041 isoform X3 [Folsomia candida]|uniref:uncharacterized protein LOC110858041 isoform X3 n=2 Tax=Folsomia candida TaxID=158441 RepID=UPI001604F55F|nr:uncharacterized protein LOC110858041 isoform X3 [Folsomia candida]